SPVFTPFNPCSFFHAVSPPVLLFRIGWHGWTLQRKMGFIKRLPCSFFHAVSPPVLLFRIGWHGWTLQRKMGFIKRLLGMNQLKMSLPRMLE
ncbi:MAG: hypothetical protein M0Z61_16385, partial [Nitrospiraceae bacterium]|nr:hypothetical protein [Nitrospiraceae bacterium]